LDAIYSRQDCKLKLASQGGGPDTTIHITGGLPELPGCNILTPQLNGHNGHVIDSAPVQASIAAPDAPPNDSTEPGERVT
jgi:hypothetical protein